jgi:enamine deaminase RidA (YjgF/YER057c/UK114 family)
MGKHFPAMVLVEVSGLLEEAAKVEIEGVALLRA